MPKRLRAIHRASIESQSPSEEETANTPPPKRPRQEKTVNSQSQSITQQSLASTYVTNSTQQSTLSQQQIDSSQQQSSSTQIQSSTMHQLSRRQKKNQKKNQKRADRINEVCYQKNIYT